MTKIRAGLALSLALALTACGGDAPEPEAEQTDIPDEIEAAERPATNTYEPVEGSTPMDERMATIGIVNKRNNITQDIEMMPGETRRIGDVIVRLAACERTAPWEERTQTGGFVQVFVNERPDAGADTQWQQIFSGWLFKEMPSLNVVEHPVYDVWFKDCAMTFPGEGKAAPDDSDSTEE